MTDATPGLSWATRIQGDRPTAFDTAAHRGRTVIERGICDLEEWCGSATCYLPGQTRHATPRHATPRHAKIASYRAAAILHTTVTWTACLSNTP